MVPMGRKLADPACGDAMAACVWISASHGPPAIARTDASPGVLAPRGGPDVEDPPTMAEGDLTSKRLAITPSWRPDASWRAEDVPHVPGAVADSNRRDSVTRQDLGGGWSRQRNREQDERRRNPYPAKEWRVDAQGDQGLHRVGAGALGETGQPLGRKPRPLGLTSW